MRTIFFLFSLLAYINPFAQLIPHVEIGLGNEDPDAPVYYDEGYVDQDAYWYGPGWYWGVYFGNEGDFWGWHGNHWGHDWHGGGHYHGHGHYHGGGHHGGGHHH